MQRLIVLLFVLFAEVIGASLAFAGSPSVVGSWNITFLLEPNRSTGATQCVVFRSVPGRVAGVPTSGTWSSPTFPGWFGEWIQLGDHVRWFGITSNLATSESGNMENVSRMGGVSFNHFSKSAAMTSSAGAWIGFRVSQCPGVQSVGGNDPAGIATKSTDVS